MLSRNLVVFVVFLMALTTQGFAEPLPGIETEQPVFDFGEVLRGQSVTHTFEFRNNGTADLVVDRVKSTCGCTGVLLSDKIIAPGGVGTVKATFNSSRFQGHVEKRILLYSNVAGAQPTTFTVKGTVIKPFEAKPARIQFGAISVGQSKTVTTVLTNNSGQTVTLKNIRTSNTAVRAEIDVNELKDRESAELRVIAEPGDQDTSLSGAVLIQLDLSGVGEVSIPFGGGVFPAKTSQ